MKLIIENSGDSSVGINDEWFEIQCPFERGDLADEDLQLFKKDMVKLYSNYCNGKVTALFDFEYDEIFYLILSMMKYWNKKMKWI